jgi:hypothetical protein
MSSTTPSLAFSRAFASCQTLLLLGAVIVLTLALTMMVRLYHALSAPTKTLICMMAANLLGALVSLLQACHQLTHLVEGHFLEPHDDVCRVSQPIFVAFEAVTWWGHLLLAWMTWRTICGQKRPGPLVFNTLLYGVSLFVGVLVISEMEQQVPGEVLWGLFCVTPFLSGEAEKRLDIRWFTGIFCQVTLAVSVLLYAAGFWKLRKKIGGAVGGAGGRRGIGREGGVTAATGAGASAATPAAVTIHPHQQQQAIRLRQASKALLHRSVLILVAYYLPYILIHCAMSRIQEKLIEPNPTLLVLFFLGFVFGQPVLQSLILIHAAVTVGNNLLSSTTSASTHQQRKKEHMRRVKKQQEMGGEIGSGGGAATAAAAAAMVVPAMKIHSHAHVQQYPQQQQQQQEHQIPPFLQGVVTTRGSSTSISTSGGVSPTATSHKRPPTSSRSFHDPTRGHTRTHSRERVQVMATIYEVTFKKGRAKRLRAVSSTSAAVRMNRSSMSKEGKVAGGAATTATPATAAAGEGGRGSGHGNRIEAEEGAMVVQEYLGKDGHSDENYPPTDDEEEEDNDEEDVGYEEEEQTSGGSGRGNSSLSSRFDDGGRSAVFDEEEGL